MFPFVTLRNSRFAYRSNSTRYNGTHLWHSLPAQNWDPTKFNRR